MRSRVFFAGMTTASTLAGCLLVTSLDGLAGGTASGADAAEASTPADAPADVTSPGDTGLDADADAGAPADGGGIVLQQEVSLTFVGDLSLAHTFPLPVTAGNLLVGVVLSNNVPDAGYAVHDSLGNTWKSTAIHRQCLSKIGIEVFYAENTAPGADTVTATQTSATGQLGLSLFEYAGIAASQALDVDVGQCAQGSTLPMDTSAVTTTANDLLLGVFADPCGTGHMEAGAGWSVVDRNDSYFYILESKSGDDGSGVPAGGVVANASNDHVSNCWLGVLAAFKRR